MYPTDYLKTPTAALEDLLVVAPIPISVNKKFEIAKQQRNLLHKYKD